MKNEFFGNDDKPTPNFFQVKRNQRIEFREITNNLKNLEKIKIFA